MNSVANLNTVDENSDRFLYFGAAAIGKPTECRYGIIENFSLGSITNINGSY